MKTRWPLVVLAVAVGAGACAGQPLSSLTTSLTGFTVLRSARPITSFRSDDQGHFTVHLAPGAYTVVPGLDAPILSPQSERKDVVVGPSGLTTVRLAFDTGIRQPCRHHTHDNTRVETATVSLPRHRLVTKRPADRATPGPRG